MHFTQGLPLKAGFIHVPFLPEQVADRPETPWMELAQIVDGLRAAVSVAVNGGAADAQVGGATH
jgi:pyroglutamyl-peptidase